MTEEKAEQMRQFEVVAKVALQTGVSRVGGVKNRVSMIKVATEQFGLTRHECLICLGRAQVLLANVSNSVSSDTLLMSQRRRQLKIAA